MGMKKENTLSILIGAFLIIGCTVSPTPPVDRSPTPLNQPPLLPLPSKTAMVEEKERVRKEEGQKTATPTSTPEPPLRTNGPYLAYFRSVNQVDQFVLMDMDASGKKVINLPLGVADALPNKEQDLNMNMISPDGHWMAFFTGSAGSYGEEMPGTGTCDLPLNLMDLTTGEQQVINPLLSKDYPDNFIEAANELNDPY